MADRAIAIVRVSQRDKDALSPEVQVASMAGLADRHGWGLAPEDVLDENVDANGKVRNVSGGWDLEGRPKLRYALEQVEARKAQVIIAERLDRLFRDFDHQRAFIDRVERVGGRIVTVNQGSVSHETAEAEATANMHGVMAQYMKRTAKERSWAAVELAIERGKSPGPAPPGYLRGSDGVLVPDPKTTKIVQEAFQRRADGVTLAEVRAFLAKHGIKRTVSGVRKMLASKLYVGEVHFGKHTPNVEAHEGIIDPEVFKRVGKMVVSAGRHTKSERLLARLGVLRCGTCGGRMSASTGAGGSYPIYRCTSQNCSRPVTISAEIIERAVITKVIEYRRSNRGQARGEQKAQEAEEQAKRAEDRLQRTILLLDDFGDVEATHQKLAVLREDAEHKRERAGQLAAAFPPVVTVDAEVVFKEGTLEGKRSLIRNTIERITIAPGRGSGRVAFHLLGQ